MSRYGPARRPLAERFWPKVDKRGTEECWPWLGCTNADGYGSIVAGGHSGQKLYAHRVAYELLVGPIPRGFTIDHVRLRGCTRRDCCNPAHLEPVTQRTNTMRGDTGPARNAAKTRCKRGHLFNAVSKRGHRVCLTCCQTYMREYRNRLLLTTRRDRT